MKNFIVYRHLFPNKKVYIGITQQQPEKRWKLGQGYVGQDYIYKAIQKYGWDNIKHEILFTGLNQEEAEQKERELIVQHKSTDRNYGYNIALGGNHQGKTSQETKEKISQSNQGKKRTPEQNQLNRELRLKYYKEHPEAKEKARQQNLERLKDPKFAQRLKEIGKANGERLKGKKRPPEVMEKLRQANIGRKVSDETRKKIGLAGLGRTPWNKGISPSVETRKKLRLANLGKKQSEETKLKRILKLKGRKRAPEVIEKYIKAQNNRNKDWEEKRLKAAKAKCCKKVVQSDLNGNFIRKYTSATEAAQKNNLCLSRLAKACRENKIYKNFLWTYQGA